MPYDRDVFMNQFPLVKWFVYHLTYYRVLKAGYTERQLQSEFWTLTIDAHLFQATNYWCMVFGADGRTNPTHWKRLCVTKPDEFSRIFNEGLFQNTGLDQESWKQYWRSMKEFRDKYAAHRETDFNNPVPNFDTALAVAYYYDGWVRTIITPDAIPEPPLERFAEGLKASFVPTAHKLLGITEEFDSTGRYFQAPQHN